MVSVEYVWSGSMVSVEYVWSGSEVSVKCGVWNEGMVKGRSVGCGKGTSVRS